MKNMRGVRIRIRPPPTEVNPMALAFDIDRAVFEAALAGAQNIAQKRSPAQLLTNVRLETTKGGVRLFATDYDVSLTREVPADIRVAGTAALPAKVLHDIVRKAAGDRVSLEVDDKHQGVLKAGSRSKYKLVGLDPDDFPETPKIKADPALELDRADFVHWLRKTIFASSTDEARASLAGVFLEAAEDPAGLRFVSTDTHRLALMEVGGIQASGILPPDGVILPRKALQELLKVLGGEGVLRLSVDGPQVRVAWDETVFIFRTVEGRFPSYRTVIPEAPARKAVLNREAFEKALDRVSLVITERYKSVLMRFDSDTLTLIAKNPDMGEGEEQIDCVFEGEPLEVGFNAAYVQEALAEIAEASVELRLTDDVSPAILRGEGDDGYLNVVMPMRI
jgi:DNA polymerase-3 subunit beta